MSRSPRSPRSYKGRHGKTVGAHGCPKCLCQVPHGTESLPRLRDLCWGTAERTLLTMMPHWPPLRATKNFTTFAYDLKTLQGHGTDYTCCQPWELTCYTAVSACFDFYQRKRSTLNLLRYEGVIMKYEPLNMITKPKNGYFDQIFASSKPNCFAMVSLNHFTNNCIFWKATKIAMKIYVRIGVKSESYGVFFNF